LLYTLLKFPAKIAFRFYCKKLRLNHPAYLHANGPLLIAANHPNSFLDAIVFATIFKKPICSLARGDAYKKPFYAKLLYALNILPVYRLSEGAENLGANYKTFEICKDIFRKNGIVLIFSEGRCINEWKLRPLMKGTARLAFSAWEDGIPLQVLPTGINYSNFRTLGKQIDILFSAPFGNEFKDVQNGKALNAFNEKLFGRLNQLVYQITEGTPAEQKTYFDFSTNKVKRALLAIPSTVGYTHCAPLYFSVKQLIKNKWNNDHFDSLLTAILFLIYPVYLFLTVLILYFIAGTFSAISAAIVLPLCAIALNQFRNT
jgi:1-acyl-sn-glycerol-3-phosphate acyltransferase